MNVIETKEPSDCVKTPKTQKLNMQSGGCLSKFSLFLMSEIENYGYLYVKVGEIKLPK